MMPFALEVFEGRVRCQIHPNVRKTDVKPVEKLNRGNRGAYATLIACRGKPPSRDPMGSKQG